ncbi:BREX-2 system adenine-specific DNA-methyltransferase PglX [Kitasatospora sp. NPDC004799]|uniref:BREX-2 system adenine-specific DNA-methyltransferase PglX n=1 Tax=Kitasatospora sp. NPDC004799 TaxID=3154460 RepID=UPI0033B9E93F
MVAGQDERTGLDKDGLLRDLRKQVVLLEDDLRERSESEDEFRTRLKREYRKAREAKRTAATYGAWRDERVTQSAVAWVLGCVFVRFCEDNGLIEEPFLAGPGNRLTEAEERHDAFFREFPHLNNRDWLIAAFKHLAESNTTAAGLFDEQHNPLWELTPSYEAATELLRFWRRWGTDGQIQYDFTDPEWDTRFLGDLYQDLSDHARKTYALLQTPEFVEEFILDLTLEPAIEEFGLNPVWEYPEGTERRGLRTIDPACGSGHFLLGIFQRLVEKWRQAEPATNDWVIVRRALESVHGCDKNPFAANIARFRLLVAAMRVADTHRLKDAPAFPISVSVGDSLLHGRGAAGIQGELGTLFSEEVDKEGKAFTYSTEDIDEFATRQDLLGRGSYHVVVGNPPYITPKDKQENENYRDSYTSAAGKYALSAPFAQRLFELAIRGIGGAKAGGGYVGQITANSFMKREFGKKLIEEFFRNSAEISHVIDTSGAFIPGHGTPTVILIGRNRIPSPGRDIRSALGIKGEPSQPENPATGNVWRAITEQIGRPGSESEWVSVEDIPSASFSTHPWSVSGGGAGETFSVLEKSTTRRLGALSYRVGVFGVLGSDDAMIAPRRAFRAHGVEDSYLSAFTVGDEVRDWTSSSENSVLFPYSSTHELQSFHHSSGIARWLWPLRTELGNRATFARRTYFIEGRPWYEWHQLPKDEGANSRTIIFSFVATHNHFTLDRGGRAFNRSAPMIKLPERASEDEHLGLLGLLNSSTACFCLKQVSQAKGGTDNSSGGGNRWTPEAWIDRYEFTGTKLQEFPLPQKLPLELGGVLDTLAQEVALVEPPAVCETTVPCRKELDLARAKHRLIRRRMIALQEELDWEVYGLYGLLTEKESGRLTAPSPDPETVPEVKLGERAFEIVLARKVAAGEAETAWFERHGSTPITEMPTHWPEWYREIVQARIDTIESRRDIALIERPECKRRWSTEPWEKKEKAALRTWLLDRCENEHLWFVMRDGMKQPRRLTVNQLADELRDDADVVSVAQLYAADHLGKPDLSLTQVLAEVVADEHVPYLSAMRYKDSGLRKREQWEFVWEEQRKEDRTGKRLDIPVPPKYTSADFLKASYWSQRGKLDVPKERFISYLEASPDGDPTVLLGWAGWDHKDQAQALINLIEDRTEQAAWGTDRILPLLAGLHEIMPWVRQWHGEYDAEWGTVPADDCEAYLSEQMAKHRLTSEDLKAWRPERKTRGRKPAAKKRAAEQPALDEE